MRGIGAPGGLLGQDLAARPAPHRDAGAASLPAARGRGERAAALQADLILGDDKIPGDEVSPQQPAPVLVSGAEIGTDLSIYARVVPQLLDEVRISDDALEVTFKFSLPVDKNGRPIKGLVVYTWAIRQKRPGEDDSVRRAVEWMKTRAYQTHDAQIRMELQLGAAERIAFHVAFATGFAFAATEPMPEVAASLGAAAAGIGAGGTAAGTGAGGATVIRLGPAVVENITKAAAAVMLSLHGAALGPSRR